MSAASRYEPATAGPLGAASPAGCASNGPTSGRTADGEDLVMHLERDQLVAETFRPLPRAHLGRKATGALWALRIFVAVVGLMVIYTFVAQLH